jgi:hypothetical protein
MDEDVFNMEVRKFLNLVGVTSQREIEDAVRKALAAKKLGGKEALKVRAVLTIEKVGLSHEIEGTIKLA